MLWLLKSTFSALLTAVGQFFLWLNRREIRKEHDADNQRIAETQAAAAQPNAENADLLNRWLARGRAGRLRDGSPQ